MQSGENGSATCMQVFAPISLLSATLSSTTTGDFWLSSQTLSVLSGVLENWNFVPLGRSGSNLDCLRDNPVRMKQGDWKRSKLLLPGVATVPFNDFFVE